MYHNCYFGQSFAAQFCKFGKLGMWLSHLAKTEQQWRKFGSTISLYTCIRVSFGMSILAYLRRPKAQGTLPQVLIPVICTILFSTKIFRIAHEIYFRAFSGNVEHIISYRQSSSSFICKAVPITWISTVKEIFAFLVFI